MAIVLKNNKYNLVIDSKTIIGVMGEYNKFLESMVSDNIFYLDNRISLSKKEVSSLLKDNNLFNEYLDKSILNKKVYELSHSQLKLVKYLMMIESNKKINIIDEPFIDLDYENKKKIKLLFNKMVKDGKTIIIGSKDSNIIYSICKKILIIDKDNYYGDISSLHNKKILNKYNIKAPNLVEFVNIVKDKKVKLRYSNDIRDLIKDVYRNVSKK